MEVTEAVCKEALQQIQEHISGATICMASSNILEWSLQRESLNSQWLDSSGSIWFLCFNNNDESSSLADGRMELFYSNRINSKYLSLVGEVSWTSFEEAITIDGFPFTPERIAAVERPVRLARFFPEEAFFWDDLVKDMVPLSLFDSPRRRRNRLVA